MTISHGPETSRTDGMRLSMLGGFQLARAGEVHVLPLAVQRVAAFLALHPQPLLRAYVAGRLWLDANEQKAHASLRTALWRARLPIGDLLEATATHLRLGAGVRVDLHDVTAGAQRVLGRTDADAEDLRCLLRTGELLPDWYDDWLITERERVRQLRCLALEALCDRFRSSGRHAEATQAALAAIGAEPLRESAHRALIKVHLDQGNLVDALRQYRILATLLRRDLGIGPSGATRALLRRPRTA